MFEGLLEEGLRIYATTAANAHESSWGAHAARCAAQRARAPAAPALCPVWTCGSNKAGCGTGARLCACHKQAAHPAPARQLRPLPPAPPAGTYCPGMSPSPPPEFGTCLGDLYSVAWMENAEHADLTLGGGGGQGCAARWPGGGLVKPAVWPG